MILSTEATERIAAARRTAETDLKSTIASIPESPEIETYTPAFESFAAVLFDAHASELLHVIDDRRAYERVLEREVVPQIVEGIMPDRGVDNIKPAGLQKSVIS